MRRPAAPAWRRLALALALTGVPALASAATCTVAISSLAFGVYNPQSASPNNSSGSVTVLCLPVVISLMQSYTLSLSSGSTGSYAQRRMSSGANTLHYQLYTSAARSAVWGDGSAGTVTVAGSFVLQLLSSVTATHAIYGTVLPLQTGAVAGAYADTVLVTVSY